MKVIRQKKIFIRMLATVLTLAVLFALAAPALAADVQVYATTGLNVRSGPGAKYPVIGGLEKGDAVTKTGESGKWFVITYNGRKAYAYGAYLKPKDSSGGNSGNSTSAQTKMYATTSVNVRAGASTKSALLGYLDKGDEFMATGVKSGNWVQGIYNGKTAYVYGKYLTTAAPTPTPTPKPVTPDVTPKGDTVYTTVLTYMYQEPSASSMLLMALPVRQALVRLGTTGAWSFVQLGTVSGYVQTSNLSTTNSGSSNTGTTTNVYTTVLTYMYQEPSASSPMLMALPVRQALVRLGTTGAWSFVRFGNVNGYVLTSNLSTSNSGSSNTGTTTNVYTTAFTYMYQSPSTSSTLLMTLPANQALVRLSTTGAWSLVQLGTVNGYVQTSNLAISGSGSSNAGNTGTSTNVYTTTMTYMYQSPSTSSTLLMTLPANQTLVRLGATGAWTYVQLGTVSGYVQTSNISGGGTNTTDTLNPTNMYLYATGSVPLYTAMSTTGTVKQYLAKDQRTYCSAKGAYWAYVTTDSGVSGYVLVNSMASTPSSGNSAVPAPSGSVQPVAGLYYHSTPIAKRTNVSFVPMLKEPSTDMSNLLYSIPAINSAVTEVGVYGDYSYIVWRNVYTGYVRTEYLSVP